MANDDYGYFGKGDTGYAQYMTAFNRNFGGSSGGGGGGQDVYKRQIICRWTLWFWILITWSVTRTLRWMRLSLIHIWTGVYRESSEYDHRGESASPISDQHRGLSPG